MLEDVLVWLEIDAGATVKVERLPLVKHRFGLVVVWVVSSCPLFAVDMVAWKGFQQVGLRVETRWWTVVTITHTHTLVFQVPCYSGIVILSPLFHG
jgi:hypothetical protein